MGKSFDLLVIGDSANRAVLTPVAMAAGENNYVASTAPVGVQMKEDVVIAAVMEVSQTAAALDFRFHHSKDPEWNRATDICRLQSVQPGFKYYQVAGYELKAGQVLVAEILNAGAVLDCCGFFLDKGAGVGSPFPPGGKIPVGYKLYTGVATMTMVVDKWTVGDVVWDDLVVDLLKDYDCLGFAAKGVTGHFTRLKFKGGENIDDHPGVPCSDTDAGLDCFMLYGNFGKWKGSQGLQIEQISDTADATVEIMALMKEV